MAGAARCVEVAVVGGGTAGLSAALSLGRSFKDAVVLDAGVPRNRKAHHAHGLFTRDHTPPADLYKAAKNDLARYDSVSLVSAKVHSAKRGDNNDFTLDVELLDSEERVEYVAKRVILANGVEDILPDIPGMKELWGSHIWACPFCHGFEVANAHLGVLLTDHLPADMYPMMIRNWSRDLTVYSNGLELPDDKIKFFKTANIKLETRKIKSFAEADKNPEELLVTLEDGTEEVLTGLFTHSDTHLDHATGPKLWKELGCELTEMGFIKVDEMQATTVPGVYAAGDPTHMRHAVVTAAHQGYMAGASAVLSFVMENVMATHAEGAEGK